MKTIQKDKSSFVDRIASKVVLMAALFFTMIVVNAQSEKQVTTTSSLGTLKQINAGLLNVGYTEAGPSNGTPVILLHGWPYDIHSYNEVVPILVAKGYRVLTPYLRGSGTTIFLSKDTFRNGQQAALASDIIAFMDALKIDKATIGGFDWGARTAVVMAALWPERLNGLVSVSGYLVVNLEANLKPLPPQAELGWWYQYGCPILNFGVEADDTNPAMKEQVKKAIRSAQNRFFIIAEEGIKNKELSSEINPEHFSIKVFAMIEGAILCRKILGNDDQMKIILDSIKTEFENYVM